MKVKSNRALLSLWQTSEQSLEPSSLSRRVAAAGGCATVARVSASAPPAAPIAARRLSALLGRFARLSPFVKPYFGRLGLVFLLSSFGAVLGLLWPLFTKILIDDVLLARNLPLLFMLSGLMVGATLLGTGVGAVNRYVYTQVTARVLFALRQHLFAHVQKLSLRFHTRARVGDVLTRLNTDIADIQAVLTDAAFTFATNLFVLCASVGFLVWLEWRLFLVSLAVVPLQIYGIRKVQPRLVAATRRVRELNASISSFLVESLSAVKFVKQFGAETVQLDRLARLGRDFVHTVTRYEMVGYVGSTTTGAASFLGGALVTVYGGYLVIDGQLSIGSLVAFTAYQSRALGPIQVLMDLYLRIERAGVSVDRVFEFLDLGEGYRESAGGTRRLGAVRGDVEFRNVTFGYRTGEPVLHGLNFRVPAGQRLTILGPSGVGKSTLVDLLIRLYEPDAGSILLDGHDVRDLDTTWLRQQVVVLGHEPVLFNASVFENVRYASPQASRGEVARVLETVGLHDYVTRLPNGYDTLLGERGARLSAGQRQRVALARALLKNPSVLVLDEAVSGLDAESEADIRAALAAAMRDRTTLVVTHRLTSLRLDDAVLALTKGHVAWQGCYRDLTQRPEILRGMPGHVP